MSRKLVIACVALVVVLFSAGSVFALDVLVPNEQPLHIVLVRKYAMVTNFQLYSDLSAKVKAGTIKAMVADARALVVIGSVLPLAFADTYSSVYPVQGDKYFYKGGNDADFMAKAQAFTTAAEELVAIADKEDKAGAEAQVTKLFGTCGACHAAYRGSY